MNLFHAHETHLSQSPRGRTLPPPPPGLGGRPPALGRPFAERVGRYKPVRARSPSADFEMRLLFSRARDLGDR